MYIALCGLPIEKGDQLGQGERSTRDLLSQPRGMNARITHANSVLFPEVLSVYNFNMGR